MHIVDELIYERAPRLVASPLWPVVKPALYGLLGYGHAVAMADAIRELSGDEALAYVSDLLRLDVAAAGLDHLPEKGRCVVVCNHPTGIADGVAVFDALKRRRDDAIFFANADALRVSPRLGEAVIPVEWVESKRTREKTRATLMAAREAFEAERCVVIFPAGRISRRDAQGRLTDPVWATTGVSLAAKYQAPILPVHVAGPYSFWFHSFHRVSKELRDVTLFQELLNKTGKRFELTVGPAIDATTFDKDASEITLRLKTYIERELPEQPQKGFAC